MSLEVVVKSTFEGSRTKATFKVPFDVIGAASDNVNANAAAVSQFMAGAMAEISSFNNLTPSTSTATTAVSDMDTDHDVASDTASNPNSAVPHLHFNAIEAARLPKISVSIAEGGNSQDDTALIDVIGKNFTIHLSKGLYINVQPNDGSPKTMIHVVSSDRFARVKEKIEEKIGLPPIDQRLIFQGKQLCESRTLDEIPGIENGSTLHLVKALRGCRASGCYHGRFVTARHVKACHETDVLYQHKASLWIAVIDMTSKRRRT